MISARHIGTVAVGLSILVGGSPSFAQHKSDPPWNAEHIDALPPEIRAAVLAMCPTRPQAAHYFATYLDNSHRINLHFEKFHCEQRATLCNNAGCLHQVYAFANGHYRLAKSFYGPDND